MTYPHNSIQLSLIAGPAAPLEPPAPEWSQGWPDFPYTDYAQPWRQLMAAVLLRACLDAHRGDLGARYWLNSRNAADLAAWLGLYRWPPRLDQLASKRGLIARIREI